jgi:UDP-N-acetylglucosamine 2-epimerase
MPEELNRVLTDHVATLLCCPTETAVANLRAEGFGHIAHEGRVLTAPEAENLAGPNPAAAPLVVNTGDVMYDAYLLGQDLASRHSKIAEQWGLAPRAYFLATVHRAENTDDPQALARILEAFKELSRRHPVIWPLHPRTRQALEATGLAARLTEAPMVKLLAPVGYFDMLTLERHAAAILTDSGGVQKEAFFAGTPCVTLRAETEWVETVATGRNILVGTDPAAICRAALQPVGGPLGDRPYGFGKAAECIISCLHMGRS